jgi:hypothetical protein
MPIYEHEVNFDNQLNQLESWLNKELANPLSLSLASSSSTAAATHAQQQRQQGELSWAMKLH